MPYKDKERQKAAQRKYDRQRREPRGETWSIVAYPESLPDDWMEYLNSLHIPFLISPLHDADLNADDTEKKPHYHIVPLFESLKSFSQVKEISDRLNAPAPMKQDSRRGIARYLTHMDNPEKAQYNPDDVICLGGADYRSLVAFANDKYRLVAEMQDFIDQNAVYSFASFMRYARKENEDWFRALCDNCSWVIKEYIKSAAWESKKGISDGDAEVIEKLVEARLKEERDQMKDELMEICKEDRKRYQNRNSTDPAPGKVERSDDTHSGVAD